MCNLELFYRAKTVLFLISVSKRMPTYAPLVHATPVLPWKIFYGLSASSATSQSKQRRALAASERLGRSVLFISFKVSYFGAAAQVRWREVGRSQIGVLLNQQNPNLLNQQNPNFFFLAPLQF